MKTIAAEHVCLPLCKPAVPVFFSIDVCLSINIVPETWSPFMSQGWKYLSAFDTVDLGVFFLLQERKRCS